MTEQWPYSTGYTPVPAAPLPGPHSDVYDDVPPRVADGYGPVPVSPGPFNRAGRTVPEQPRTAYVPKRARDDGDMQVTPADLPTIGERALAVVKDIVVIVTCLVLLYTIWRGYVALNALGEGLRELGDSWSQIGQ